MCDAEEGIDIAYSTNTTNDGGFLAILNDALFDNPDAVILATPNVTPGGLGEGYNNSPVGVAYMVNAWVLFNEDLTELPIGTAFNLEIHPSPSQGTSMLRRKVTPT